jgi:hypothetical protein
LDRFGPVYSGPVAKIPRPSGSAGRKLRDAESRPLFDFVVTNRCYFKLARSVTFRCLAACPLAEERVVHADAQSSDVFGVESRPLKLTDANLRTVLLAACGLRRKSSSLSVRSRPIEARCSRERQVGEQQRASALFALNRRCHDPGGETLHNERTLQCRLLRLRRLTIASGSKSHPELLIGGAERIGSLDRSEASYRPRSARVRDAVAPVASRRRARRQHCLSGVSPGRMSAESQRASSRFQTLPTRYEATRDLERKLERFAAILRLRLDWSEGCCPPTRPL